MKKTTMILVLSFFCLVLFACSSSKWKECKFENVPIKSVIPIANDDEVIALNVGLKIIFAEMLICSGHEVTEIFFPVRHIGYTPLGREAITVMARPDMKYKFKTLVFKSNGKYNDLDFARSSIVLDE